MVIDNTVQMNDFSNGMNTDISDAILEKNTYRMAKNLRYVTNTQHNTAELHMIEGAVNVSGILAFEDIKDSTQLRDLGIVITANENSWKVYTIKGTDVKCVADISDVSRVVPAKKLSLVTRYENEKNLKLYIADGLGPILSIQLIVNEPITDLNEISAYTPTTFTVPIFCGLIDGALKAPVVEYSYQLYNKYGNQSEISPSTKLIALHTDGTTVNESKKIQGYKQDAITDKGVRIKINISDDKFEYVKVYRISYIENGQLPTIELIYDKKISDRELYINDVGGEALGTLTLEEYNSMSGIHIIPKTIESKDGYMFAANIKTDKGSIKNSENNIFDGYDTVAVSYNHNRVAAPDPNPYCSINTEYGLGDDDAYAFISSGDILGGEGTNISWKFISTDIIGEYNNNDEYINIFDDQTTNKFNTIVSKQYLTLDDNNQNQIRYTTDGNVDLSTFIESSDDSLTYANSQVSYSLKSLRRGELYRYGIILYDNEGNNSQVKWIADIRVPSVKQAPSFYINTDGELIVKPIGIEFTVSNLPDNIVSYEIVRCIRSSSDTSIVSQGILARPIRRYINSQDSKYVYTTEYPFTPTGWMTTDNYTSVSILSDPDQYIATNTSNNLFKREFTSENGWGDPDYVEFFSSERDMDNLSVFLFASPEVCYASKDFQDIVDKYNVLLQLVNYLLPLINKDINPPKPNLSYNNNSYAELFNWVRFGNLYTHLPINESEIVVSNVFDGNGTSPYTAAMFLAYYWKSDQLITGDSDNITEIGGLYTEKRRNAYVKLYNNLPSTFKDYTIDNIEIAKDLKWNYFAEGDSLENSHLIFQDKITVVGTNSYVNWVCGGGFGIDVATVANDSGSIKDKDKFMMGPGGKCAVLELQNVQSWIMLPEHPFGTYLCNIRRNIVPYGGYDENARKLSTYKSFGNYFNKEKSTIQVFDGDSYIMPFEYISQHKWEYALVKYERNACIVYSIPVETSINLALTDGYEFSKNYKITSQDISYLQLEPSNIGDKFVQSDPLYSYNTVYSVQSSSQTHSADNNDDDDLDEGTDFRVYHSLLKSDNEVTDSWLKFLSSNYLDVDSRHGAITGLRKFNNQLIFWQEDAMGLLSVNERTAISDDSGLPLILGTGDVLTRYDYVDTSNGMREDEYCDAQSDSILYWWDHNKHELCSYSRGLSSAVLSKLKYVQNYINLKYENDELCNDPALIFDKRFNELMSKIDNASCLVYNENIGAFTGVYDIRPKCDINFVDRLWMFNYNGVASEWNKKSGDSVSGINSEPLLPYLKYTVNDNVQYTKVFDNGAFAGRVYGGDKEALLHLTLDFSTPHKQHGSIDGSKITNREYNFEYAIPRNGEAAYGERLRGRTMSCELRSDSNSYDFSLLFTLNKYRISWS